MKKVIILICLIFIISACQSQNNTNSKILKKNFEEVEKYFEDKESFILYVGRSDCSDCRIFEKELKNISISKETMFVKLDIKKYRDLAKADNSSIENIEYYDKIKDYFKLTWTPTIYYVKDGKIVSKLEYLDKNYHSLSESEQQESKKKFDEKVKYFIENYN